MSDVDEWVATFVRKCCPACGKPVTHGKRHGARATCGNRVCMAITSGGA